MSTTVNKIHTGPVPKTSLNIVVIEDDYDDSELLTEAFSELSSTSKITCVKSAELLFTYLDALPDTSLPDLLITDLNIPIINGIAILNMLNENPRYAGIPKIVYSNSSNPADERSSISAGALIYIKKPNTIAAIKENAKEMLGYCK
jgi:CheY-like chemotaxis protein